MKQQSNNVELLFSNYPPLITPYKEFQKEFIKRIQSCDNLTIATGYASADSLLELKRIIELNKKPQLDVIIGMLYFEGFTTNELNAALSLNNVLIEHKLGALYCTTAFMYHGKIYCFQKNNKPVSSIVGSSNLTCISSGMRTYETDLSVYDDDKNIEIYQFLSLLKEKASKNINDCKTAIKNKSGQSPLENNLGVEQCTDNEYLTASTSKTQIAFQIPLKTEAKSNLNVYFGKGRENKSTGIILPRPWYEIEIIVPKVITDSKDYPKASKGSGNVINVITDDKWKFRCKISGDYNKNFRSEGDLQILGKWIKGRLEDSGSLIVGDPVTENALNKYGRNYFDLIKTKIENTWFLDFGVKK